MSQGVAPLRTRFTALERTAIGELLDFAKHCSESTNPALRVLSGLAVERAAAIMRGQAELHTCTDRDIAGFAELWVSTTGALGPIDELVIRVKKEPGRCRWCSCTYERPCASGCGWANREQTLCTACVNFDRLMRSAKGRAQLLEQIGEAGIL